MKNTAETLNIFQKLITEKRFLNIWVDGEAEPFAKGVIINLTGDLVVLDRGLTRVYIDWACITCICENKRVES